MKVINGWSIMSHVLEYIYFWIWILWDAIFSWGSPSFKTWSPTQAHQVCLRVKVLLGREIRHCCACQSRENNVGNSQCVCYQSNKHRDRSLWLSSLPESPSKTNFNSLLSGWVLQSVSDFNLSPELKFHWNSLISRVISLKFTVLRWVLDPAKSDL